MYHSNIVLILQPTGAVTVHLHTLSDSYAGFVLATIV